MACPLAKTAIKSMRIVQTANFGIVVEKQRNTLYAFRPKTADHLLAKGTMSLSQGKESALPGLQNRKCLQLEQARMKKCYLYP
jgi:hypothetical protein